MSFHVRDIDHLMVRVARLQEGAERFEALGFTVAPSRSRLAAGSDDPVAGAAVPDRPYDNRLVLFEGFPGKTDVANFIGLACLQDQFGAPWRLRKQMSFLWDTEGPKTVVTYSDDIERTFQAMRDAGLEAELGPVPPEDVGWVDPETGGWVPVRNRPCNPTFRQLPFMVNAYTTDTMPSFRRPAWVRHANTAKRLSMITGITDDLERDAAWMAELVFGVAPEWHGTQVALVRPRDVALRIVTPAGFDALYPGLDFSTERILPALCGATIEVASLAATSQVLDEAGIPYVETPGGGIAVPRQSAANTLLEFVQPERGDRR